MQEKIKQYLTKEKLLEYSEWLRDVRFTGLVLFGVIVLLITWSGVKVIQTNYGLQKQIATLRQQNDVQRLENTNQKLANDYLLTDQYLELTARENFGKAAPGEKEILVPKTVALAHTVDLPKPKVSTPDIVVKKPTYQRNLEAWFDFFFHGKDNTN